ncbi:unnamed protein product, partial [Rotaria socialis]
MNFMKKLQSKFFFTLFGVLSYQHAENQASAENNIYFYYSSLTNSSSTHHLNLSPFIERNAPNSNTLFPSPTEMATPSSPVSLTNVY